MRGASAKKSAAKEELSGYVLAATTVRVGVSRMMCETMHIRRVQGKRTRRLGHAERDVRNEK